MGVRADPGARVNGVRGPRRVLVVEVAGGPLGDALARDPAFEVTDAGGASPLEGIGLGVVDAVVIDLNASDDAETTVRALAGRAPEVAVVVVAPRASERIMRCLREGAHDYARGADDVASAVQRACVRLGLARAREQRDRRAALATLLGNVAHELNNPLGILLGQADLLAETVESGPLKDRARKVMQATERCAGMIKDFLMVARRQPRDQQKVDVARLLRDAVQALAPALEADRIEVDVQVEEPTPTVIGDREQLRHAIANLLGNAHHAMQDTTGPRRLTCTIRLDPASHRLHLAIADTGCGVPEPLHARIFEPFFGAFPTKRGSGLGLTVVQSVVEGHGGTVEVASSLDAGATFTIALPVMAPAEDLLDGLPTARGRTAPAGVEPLVSPPAPAGGASILLVEDKPEVATMLTDMLSIDGHHVDTAVDGLRALDRLEEIAYDVVLSDVRMPGLDGPGLYEELERRHPRLRQRVIFCTGEALAPDVQRRLDRLQAPVISKPFAMDDLRRALRSVLAPAGATPRPG